MTEARSLLYAILMLVAFGGFVVAICGMMNDSNNRYPGPLLLAAAVAFGLALLIVPAHSQERHTHQGAVGKFYSTWMMPDSPKTSCCDNQDCEPAASRLVNGLWEAQRNGIWISIPPNKVEINRDSPDGRSHLCGRQAIGGSYAVFCFIAGNGT